MVFLLSLVTLVTLVCVGCTSKKGFESPDAVGKALIEAVNKQDPIAIGKLFPPKAQFDAAFDCTDTKLYDKMTRERDGAIKELDDDLKGITMVWKGLGESEEKVFPKGEILKNCTAKVKITGNKVRFKFEFTKDGRTENEDERVELIRFGDGGWWLAGL